MQFIAAVHCTVLGECSYLREQINLLIHKHFIYEYLTLMRNKDSLLNIFLPPILDALSSPSSS